YRRFTWKDIFLGFESNGSIKHITIVKDENTTVVFTAKYFNGNLHSFTTSEGKIVLIETVNEHFKAFKESGWGTSFTIVLTENPNALDDLQNKGFINKLDFLAFIISLGITQKPILE